SRVRTEPSFPFSVLPSATVRGFFDKNGNNLFSNPENTGTIGEGSLLVSSLNSVQGANCGQVDGNTVAALCNGNVIIDSATDPTTVSAVVDSRVPVTNVNPGGE